MERKDKYIIYARKSTEQEDRQVASIDSQLKEMLDIAKRDNLNIVAIEKESYSAKDQGQRKVFNKIIDNIDKGEYNCILTWATDRLGRNAGDIGRLIDLMDKDKLLKIQTSNQVLTNNPNDKFMLMILGGTAKLENDNRSINIRRGMKARAERGIITSVPTGYRLNNDRNSQEHIIIDEKEKKIVEEIFKQYTKGYSIRGIQDYFKQKNILTRQGKIISVGTINSIINNPTYFGVVEFPRGSGNYIKGTHQPIITKAEFQKAQEIKLNRRDYSKSKYDRSNLTFTSLIRCAMCDSQIVGYVMNRKQKDGTTKKHIYYRCCKYRDAYCKNKQTTENNLINEIKNIIQGVDIEKVVSNKSIKKDIETISRYGAMKGHNTETTNDEIRNYISHILEKGKEEEKREIIKTLSNQFNYLNQKLVVC